MQKYFISNEELDNKRITSDDVNHIKNVMRSKIGDEFIVSNQQNEYLVSITSIEKKYIEFEIKDELQNQNEMPIIVDIYQGYPKGDKMEDIIKHSTELGACGIFPTFMKRSIVKLDDSRIEGKTERFRKIAKEAAEQSFRKIIPTIEICRLKQIDFSSYKYKILAYEEAAKSGETSNLKRIISSLETGDRVCVVIGPEGGIDEVEVEYLSQLGFTPCAFGPRILRTETAAFYVLSALSYEKELNQ